MGIQEDINTLDSKVTKLKVEYEQYFMRVLKREPVRLREEVERIIRAYSTKSISNTSLKFRLGSIVARYNSYRQYWTRVLRAIEEGTYSRRAEGVGQTRSTPPGPAPAAQKPAPGRAAEENDNLSDAYEKYLKARKECNEPTKGLSLEKFASNVEKTRDKVKEKYKTEEIELKVYIKDGKTRLAITPKKG